MACAILKSAGDFRQAKPQAATRDVKMLKEIVQYPLSIGGVESTEFNEVKSPYSGEVVAAVAQADEKAIDLAIKQARSTFQSVMRKMPAYRRAEILSRTAAIIADNLEDFARTIALEGGKPIRDARVEVSRAVGTFTIAAEESLRIAGEHLPMDRSPGNDGRVGLVLREPVGVVGAITPFNFPLNLVAHKLAPAIAAGNSVVLKPSSQTPVSSFKLAEAMKRAGLPDGALTLTPCRGSKGNALVRDPRLALVTFTGSPEVGWRLRREAAAGVRVTLELGGNAGLVVHEDADLEAAARAAAKGGYVNAGQSCISVQRVYVHEKVYDSFAERFLGLVKGLKVGDPLDETVDVGPVIDEGSARSTIEWIEEAVKGGARVLAGGKLAGKNCVLPTVLADTRPDMRVICQEVFAPVVCLVKYADIDEAIEAVNDERWGLQAGIFTGNLEIAFKAARKIDAGGVMVNDAPTFRADHIPYGGRRESGLGHEGVRYALMEMTQPKFICLNLPALD